MPIATPAQYYARCSTPPRGRLRLSRDQRHLPSTLNGAMRAFAESKSDGIIQVSTGGASSRPAPRSRTWPLARLCSRKRPTRWRTLQRPHRTPHRPLPAEEGRRLPQAAHRRHREPCRRTGQSFQLPHARRLGTPAGGEHEAFHRAAQRMRRPRDYSRGGGRRGRRRGRRRDHGDQPNEKLYTSPADMVAVHEALHGLGRSCLPPPSATCTAATSPAR